MTVYTIVYQPNWYLPDQLQYVAVVSAFDEKDAVQQVSTALDYEIRVISIHYTDAAGIAYMTKPSEYW